jgi:hypothetical protein
MDKDNQKGVSLIITFFIMIIILAVVLSISILLYSEIKIIRNVGNSVVSFYAADSGIEKVLFYDRQVLPMTFTTTACDIDNPCTAEGQICNHNVCATPAGPRGLCSIYLFDPVKYPDACPSDSSEYGVYCAPDPAFLPPVSTAAGHNGCDPSICDDCTISFTTAFDKDSKTYYVTTASVYPGPTTSDLEIKSRGFFGGAERQIQITTTPP